MKYDTVPLKTVLQPKGYIRGPFGSTLKRCDMLKTGIPVYEQQHAIYDSRTFRFFISPTKAIEMNRFAVEENDLIISCSGTVGMVSLIKKNDPKGIISQALLLLRVNPKIIDPVFLKYFFKSQEGYNSIISRSSGSVQVNISKREIIENIPVPLPTIDLQRKIAAILSALDEKIAINRAINDNLLAQAQMLYKQCFPYGVQDNLPDGWHIGTVGEIIEIHDSKRIPLSGADRAKMEKKIYPYYGAASLMDFVDNYIFDGKYLLLGEDGTVVDDAGYPILQYVWGQFWVNNHAHILTGRLGYDVESLYMLLKQTPVKSIVTGAVQPKISQANLRSVQVVIPPEHNLREYNDLVEPLFSLLRANEEECKTLSALRDTLLPKLMSGELDVSAVEL